MLWQPRQYGKKLLPAGYRLMLSHWQNLNKWPGCVSCTNASYMRSWVVLHIGGRPNAVGVEFNAVNWISTGLPARETPDQLCPADACHSIGIGMYAHLLTVPACNRFFPSLRLPPTLAARSIYTDMIKITTPAAIKGCKAYWPVAALQPVLRNQPRPDLIAINFPVSPNSRFRNATAACGLPYHFRNCRITQPEISRHSR
jgi:hypothetical protein